jgi:hypothetical protein
VTAPTIIILWLSLNGLVVFWLATRRDADHSNPQ